MWSHRNSKIRFIYWFQNQKIQFIKKYQMMGKVFLFFSLWISHFRSSEIYVNNDPSLPCFPSSCDGSSSHPFPSLKATNDFIISDATTQNSNISIFLSVSPFNQNRNYFINESDFNNGTNHSLFFDFDANWSTISLISLWSSECQTFKNCSEPVIVINKDDFSFVVNLGISFSRINFLLNSSNSYSLFDFKKASNYSFAIFNNCVFEGVVSKTVNSLITSSFSQFLLLNSTFKNIFFNSPIVSMLNIRNITPQSALIQNCSFSDITFNVTNTNDGGIFFYFDLCILCQMNFIISDLSLYLSQKNQTFLFSQDAFNISINRVNVLTEGTGEVFHFMDQNHIYITNSSFESLESSAIYLGSDSTTIISDCVFKGLFPLSLSSNNKVKIYRTHFATFIDGYLIIGFDLNQVLFKDVTCNLTGFYNATNQSNQTVYGLLYFSDLLNFLIIDGMQISLSSNQSLNLSNYYMYNNQVNFVDYNNGIVVYSLQITDSNHIFKNYSFTDPKLNTYTLETFFNDSSCLVNNETNCTRNTNASCPRPSYISYATVIIFSITVLQCRSCKNDFIIMPCDDCIYNDDFIGVCLAMEPLPHDEGMSKATLAAIVVPCVVVPVLIIGVFIWIWYRKGQKKRALLEEPLQRN